MAFEGVSFMMTLKSWHPKTRDVCLVSLMGRARGSGAFWRVRALEGLSREIEQSGGSMSCVFLVGGVP